MFPLFLFRISVFRAGAVAGAGALWLCLLSFGCTRSPEPADLLLTNGIVHTLDAVQPVAQAVAIRDGRIVFVGAGGEAAAYRGPDSEVIDLAGKTVVPGFSDSHAHLSGIGAREMQLNLDTAGSVAELLERVREQAQKSEPGEWIVGRGWIEAQWDPPVFPTRWDLDKVSPQHPVWLVRADGHAGVANSLALRVIGVHKGVKDPPGGEILRDPKTGEPTGMLIDRAQSIIRRFLPEDTPERKRQALLLGVRRSLEMGWTQLGIAGNFYEEVELLRSLYDAGEIPLRLYDAVGGPGPDADRILREGPNIEGYGGLFTLRGIKLMADGALGSRGAALLEKYDDHDSNGLLMFETDALLPLLERALRAGVQVQTHAIGDRANRFVLDLYEEAFRRVPLGERKVAEPRWRIEHAQILAPPDIPRFAKLSVIASMQPSHAITDLYFAKSRLGEERLAGAYAWRSLLDAGARLAGGSDAPVEKGDPLVEFYAAVTRKDLQGKSEQHWHAEQRVSREEALKMLTLWAAYATFEESTRGSVAAGKWADLTVLSRDIMTVEESLIPQTRCEITIVAGKIAYRR
ncbi:MAG: amidohydrolase [Bryobacterales bacterium]